MFRSASLANARDGDVFYRLKKDNSVYKRILIATDGSALAKKAEVMGLGLAKALNAEAVAVTVSEPIGALSMSAVAERTMSNPIGNYEECARAAVNRIFFRVGETAMRLGIACRTLQVKDKYPADGIVETARENGCDLIVMSSHGQRGVSALLLGSQASKVVALSDRPVLICR
jgi:nucleotide-binding universal stress UspA family protein